MTSRSRSKAGTLTLLPFRPCKGPRFCPQRAPDFLCEIDTRAAADAEIGTEGSELIRTIGRYRIDGILGEGAMGIVYKAFDPHIGRAVALKANRRSFTSDARKEDPADRLKNEAQVGARLHHPNIVAVYGYGEDGDVSYIAMELVEGTSLATLLAPKQPMPLASVLAWMTDLLQALESAHANGVVHRDIKPANLLITRGAHLKVTDFGVACINRSAMNKFGTTAGTPSYMSPEQFRGGAVDGRTDLFSAGIVLYQMLTGVRPFTGTTNKVMCEVLNSAPIPPSQRVPSLKKAFDAITTKALAKSVSNRYGSAHEFLEALLSRERRNQNIAASATGNGEDAGGFLGTTFP